MNVVNFETAKRLKEAGFPQPQVFNATQRSYIDNGKGICYVADDGEEIGDNEYFAPSATDILKELGPTFLLSVGYVLKVNQNERPFICVETVENISDCKRGFSHENPAEACAAAWLDKNENA